MPKQKGFTLIELLIVIVIIGMLTAFFMNIYPSSGAKSRDAQRKSDLKQYQTALESYSFGHDGEYPPTPGVILGLCSQLGYTTFCPDDPKASDGKHYYYTVGASNLSYYLSAELENNEDESFNLYHVMCSEGVSGDWDGEDHPTGPVCPHTI